MSARCWERVRRYEKTPMIVTEAIDVLLQNYPTHDSQYGVTRLQTRLWYELARPLNHNPEILLRTQDLPPVYEENSCLYLFTQNILVARRNRIGWRPLLFEIDPKEAWDIDEVLDFKLVDYLLQRPDSGE